MTLRPLPRTRLPALVPGLMEGHTLVLLVPTSPDDRWSSDAAWTVARAAASGSAGRRRVVLVDLDLETPSLHRVIKGSEAPGIAEAFETGNPLDEIAQDTSGVFFIPAGRCTGPAALVWSNPRWIKLANGFRSEQALLLVYLPPGAEPEFAGRPDGVIALAPDADEPAQLPGAWSALALGRVVEPPRIGSHAAHESGARRRSLVPSLATLGLALTGIGTWAILAHSELWHSDPRQVAVPAPTILPAAGAAPWTIRLAAYGTLARAVAQADRLATRGTAAFVSPLPPDAHGVVWYRVQVGAYPTREAADTARTALWSQGLAPTGQGDLLLAPYSLTVEPPTHPEQLRAQGLVGVRWGSAGPLLVGAFETAEQADYAAAALRAAGLQTTLVTRMGTHS